MTVIKDEKQMLLKQIGIIQSEIKQYLQSGGNENDQYVTDKKWVEYFLQKQLKELIPEERLKDLDISALDWIEERRNQKAKSRL